MQQFHAPDGHNEGHGEATPVGLYLVTVIEGLDDGEQFYVMATPDELGRIESMLRSNDGYADWRNPKHYIEPVTLTSVDEVCERLDDQREREAERYYNQHYQSAAQLAGESSL